ncbi:MAG: ABC transporter ATP-binding protein [Thermoprotei archaeon]
MEDALIVRNLSVEYLVNNKPVRVLNRVNLKLGRSKITGVVGESGSGKSTLALSLIGLLPSNARVVEGEVILSGVSVLTSNHSVFESLRGVRVAMIFQEPLNSLNPVYKVGYQIAEAIMVREMRSIEGEPYSVPRYYDYSRVRHSSRSFLEIFRRPKLSPRIMEEVIEVLKSVRISNPEDVVNKYPHELSGGMRQRVMIAMALVQHPDVLIADEPTTALDVTTQAKVLKLLQELAEKYNTAVMLISHDLSVVSDVSDSVAVMYLGEIVEYSSNRDLFKSPLHPYTKGLINSIPLLSVEEYQSPIPGNIPSPSNPPSGCRFHTRCPLVFEKCKSVVPPESLIAEGKIVRCHLYG